VVGGPPPVAGGAAPKGARGWCHQQDANTVEWGHLRFFDAVLGHFWTLLGTFRHFLTLFGTFWDFGVGLGSVEARAPVGWRPRTRVGLWDVGQTRSHHCARGSRDDLRGRAQWRVLTRVEGGVSMGGASWGS